MKSKKLKIALISATLAIALLIGAMAIYLSDFYRADESAISAFAPMSDVNCETAKSGDIVFAPDNASAGVIFYPGGKVDENAYKPLGAALASKGILCIIVKMPFNLAVFDVNAADGIRDSYPDVEHWYIAGHSLGGSMAASYLEKNSADYDGLILLGSYSTADLSSSELSVLSIYGSEDKVMNRDKYAANKSNLPTDLVEFIIDGGNHAYFGMYGEQKNDGTATLTNAEQINITADKIAEMILSAE